jgi:hypothetical protein
MCYDAYAALLKSLCLEATTSFNRVVTNQPLTAGVDLTYRF